MEPSLQGPAMSQATRLLRTKAGCSSYYLSGPLVAASSCLTSTRGFAGGLQSYAASMCGTRPGIADQKVRTAVISTSTLNSGRVKPDTITKVEANALPET